MGWRISALPQAEKCGLAPALAVQHPTASGRAALKGIAFHARAARSPAAVEAMNVLTTAERAEVESWAIPEVPAGAVHETPVGLTPLGRGASAGVDGLLTEGTPDVAWHEGEVAVIGDYKTGVIPVEDGPLSLQLAAYGFAVADLWGLPAMRLGIWYARRGAWEWSETIPLDGPLAADLWRRVVYAASAPPVAAPGAACETCWQRQVCPARLLPALAGPTAPELAPFAAGGGELTPARAVAGIRVIQAMRDVADRAEEHLRSAIRAGLVVEDGGRVYGPQFCQGRTTADVNALERDGHTEYLRRGRPYERWGWRRA